MTGLESFVFSKFTKMPPVVRVITYFVILFLFAYLSLVPRFVNGELVTSTGSSSGNLPYRGADLKIHVDGRVLKFRSNEDGFWSIPVVSRIPQAFDVEIFHEDEGAWFKVRLGLSDIWSKDLQVITIGPKAPYVSVAGGGSRGLTQALALLQWFVGGPSEANAGALLLPPSIHPAPHSPQKPFPDRLTKPGLSDTSDLHLKLQKNIFETVGNAAGRPTGSITNDFPLTGKSAPSYAARIQIIEKLERQHNLKIPDEHWRYLNNVGELLDYVQKREVWREVAPPKITVPPALTPDSEPTDQPVFKR